MASRHRFAVLAGGVSCVAALAGLVIASTPIASAHPLSAARTAQPAGQAPSGITARPPIGRAKPSGSKLFLGPAGRDTASPWTALKNPPPFGTPGTMLLESDGTVLVHDEPDMPGGNTFVAGAGLSTQEAPTACTTDADTQTALYQYKTGTWAAGPEIPAIGGEEYDSTDGPASVLPDGNVLFDASACVYNTPTHFFVYNAGSNTLTQIPDAPNAVNDTSYNTRMLALPNGQVLYNDGGNQMEVYTAGGTPNPSWQPSITSLSSTTLAPGRTYTLSGTRLAGWDQGAVYGDDVQDNTNFPWCASPTPLPAW